MDNLLSKIAIHKERNKEKNEQAIRELKVKR